MATTGLEDAAESQIEANYGEMVGSFDEMSLTPELLRGVYAYGFERPSTIQQRAIMPIIKGRDIVAQAQSGTGKTSTLSISVLQKIDPAVKQCQALILAPTRELAQHIQKVVVAIGDFMNVECHACFGGTSVNDDIKALQDDPQIVVGTPGRIHNMIQRHFLKTNAITMLILDETDEILARGFTEQTYDIFKLLLPQSIQVILLSATMPQDVLEVTTKFMHDPIRILIKKDRLTPEGIRQFYIMVEEERKLNTLFDLYNISASQTITFCNTRKKLEWLADNLKSRNLPFSAIHGDMTAIDRATIMEGFRAGTTHFLVATELLARGIDVQQIPLVINYDLPANHENYIHRVGRGGHLERRGIAINFVTPDNTKLLKKIEHFYTTDIEKITTNNIKPHLEALKT